MATCFRTSICLFVSCKKIDYKKINQQSFNFGPSFKNSKQVKEILNRIKKKWKIKTKISKNNFKESKLLALNCNKAKDKLHWIPTLNFNDTVDLTVDWYETFLKKPKKIHNLMDLQIKYFLSKKNDKKK